MGKAVKLKNKYISNRNRWDKQTIVTEKIIVKNYALKNKKEIRKLQLTLAKIKKIAKSLNTNDESKNGEIAKIFISSLIEKGFLNSEKKLLDDVLDINLENLLDRRLSNIAYLKKFAKTAKQARQFIVHKHVEVNGRVINSPAYLLSLKEEVSIKLRNTSSLVGLEERLEKKEKEKLVKLEEPKEEPIEKEEVKENE